MGVQIFEGNKAARIANALETISNSMTASESKADQALEAIAASNGRIAVLEAKDSTALGAVAFDKNQNLTAEQKQYARTNIGLNDIDSLTTGNVKYNTEQGLTANEKKTARDNIGAGSATDYSALASTVTGLQTAFGNAVLITEQTLTEGQKSTVRTNIGAVSPSEIPAGDNVQYVAQSLNADQKAQARQNIDAASTSDISGLSNAVSDLNDGLNNIGNFVTNITGSEGSIEVTYKNNHTSEISTGLDFDGGHVVESDGGNYLYLSKNNVDLSNDVYEPILLPATGGGGGGVGSSIALTNVIKPSTARNGADAVFSFTATASDDAAISVKWYVNETYISTSNGQSGSSFSFNAKDSLRNSDENSVKVVIESESEASLTRRWTITTVAFAINWGNAIEAIMLNTTNTNMYVPIEVSAESGSTNIVTVSLNGHDIERTVNGSQTLTVQLDRTYFLPGANVITAGMASALDSEDTADDIQFTVIWGTGVSTPVVAFAGSLIECTQYDTVDIQYFVFDPNNETTNCTLQIGSNDPRQIVANRTMQRYQYTPMEAETITLLLTCGAVSTTAQLHASQSDYNLSYYSDDSLQYILDPTGHTNADVDRENFGNLTFSQNFDWENGGFKQDPSGAPAFVVKKGNTVTLPRCLFEDSDANGKTIDVSFKITNSDQYDAVAMSELNDGSTKGLILRANNGEIRLNNVVGQEFMYCEDSRIDLSVLVENVTEQRIATVWLDGIPANVNKYTTANTLVQNDHALVIGSQHCDVWVYMIRVYNSQLSKQQMIQNYISLGSNTETKVKRYEANTILDNRDRISVAALHEAASDLTIIQISAPRMTVSKSDKVPADISITDGATVLELPASSGTVFMVQGTSSAAYGRSAYNLDIDFKGSGKKYKISENAIGVNYLNIKVNVASSENANNINAVDWYNTFQPYRTEPRQRPGVRDSVEGKPCAVFITNTNTEPVWFSSQLVQPNETILYAMGDLCNSKKNKAVFGQDGEGEHPTKACIEVSGNDTEPQRFRSTDAVFNPEADDGKGRWETTVIEEGETKAIKHFEWRMNPSSADLDEVVASWDALVAWVVSTIGDSAKFKREVGNYFAIQSLLYHFLFIEYFAAYDNVSKNTFYSYDWDETAQKYLWNIKAAYDMDTILAADNDGKPFGDYGIDYGETVDGTVSGRQYFNAATNPIWLNIQEAFYSELSSLYTTLRSAGAWNSQGILTKWDTYQDKRPHAAMVVDAYNKYIQPYKTFGMVLDNEVKSFDDSYLPRLQGSKTYWRKEFLTYQTAYMDGKYGYYSKTNSTQFRTNCETGTRTFAIKAYAKTYITMIADDNRVGSKKVLTGQEVTFDNVSVGNNTTLYITPDRLIQYIHPLNDTDNSTFAASGALKLMEAELGGTTPNTSWPAGTGVSIPSVILKTLSIQNLPNFSDSLDLSVNVELETLDTRGTNAGLITLPSFAPLTTVQLNACTGIKAMNLKKVTTFTMASGSNLVSIQTENCNSLITNALSIYLTDAVNSTQAATRRIRAIDINWDFNNLDTLTKVASTWKGYNAIGEEQNAPVVTGNIHVATLSKKKLETINNVWGEGDVDDHLDEENNIWTYGDLTITYDSLIPFYEITFLNTDGSPIQDKQGNAYVQYIDRLDTAYDPVLAGDINTPTYIDPAGEYNYTFTGWENLSGTVTAPKTVTATYTRAKITYTVKWYDKPNGTIYDQRSVEYGSEAVYDPDGTIGFPTLADQEIAGTYKVFKGWDKSTGYVTGNIDVYAQWDIASIPVVGEKELQNMTAAEIYGIAKTRSASQHWDQQDYIDIPVGHDFTFSNVNSQVLLQNRYFDGTSIVRMNDLKLFSANAPSFTLAIDYEYTDETSNAAMVSCYDTSGAEGFQLHYYTSGDNKNINVLWGDKETTVGHGCNRGIVVIRHRKGSRYMYIDSDNSGRRVHHGSYFSGDSEEEDRYGYDSYNLEALSVSSARVQTTETNAYLTFGGRAVGASGMDDLAKGWIHWCKIWYEDLGADIAAKLASWPHETWRMAYRGSNIYNLSDETGKDSASFIAMSSLPQYFDYYRDNATNTSGGWTQSAMRTFVNNRCFAALPFEWQAMIKEVQIKTKGGSDAPNTTLYTSDKIYLPAYVDVFSGADGIFVTEGSTIPWFTSTEDRIMFMGNVVNPENVFTLDEDPTLYDETYTIVEGDLWIPANASYAYMYFSAETAAKHNYLCGRPKTDPANVAALGNQGGVWVRSNSYWTRTPSNNTGGQYHFLVYAGGSVQSAYVSSSDFRRHGIVLSYSI